MAHGTFTKTDYIMGQKANHGGIQVVESILSFPVVGSGSASSSPSHLVTL